MPNRSDFRKAQKNGMGAVDALRMAQTEHNLYTRALEEATIAVSGLYHKILIDEFWMKTADKKIPKLQESFWKLFEIWRKGVITTDDIAKYNKEKCGQEITGKSLKLTGNGKWENVANGNQRYDDVRELLKLSLREIEEKGGDRLLAERIKRFLKESAL